MKSDAQKSKTDPGTKPVFTMTVNAYADNTYTVTGSIPRDIFQALDVLHQGQLCIVNHHIQNGQDAKGHNIILARPRLCIPRNGRG